MWPLRAARPAQAVRQPPHGDGARHLRRRRRLARVDGRAVRAGDGPQPGLLRHRHPGVGLAARRRPGPAVAAERIVGQRRAASGVCRWTASASVASPCWRCASCGWRSSTRSSTAAASPSCRHRLAAGDHGGRPPGTVLGRLVLSQPGAHVDRRPLVLAVPVALADLRVHPTRTRPAARPVPDAGPAPGADRRRRRAELPVHRGADPQRRLPPLAPAPRPPRGRPPPHRADRPGLGRRRCCWWPSAPSAPANRERRAAARPGRRAAAGRGRAGPDRSSPPRRRRRPSRPSPHADGDHVHGRRVADPASDAPRRHALAPTTAAPPSPRPCPRRRPAGRSPSLGDSVLLGAEEQMTAGADRRRLHRRLPGQTGVDARRRERRDRRPTAGRSARWSSGSGTTRCGSATAPTTTAGRPASTARPTSCWPRCAASAPSGSSGSRCASRTARSIPQIGPGAVRPVRLVLPVRQRAPRPAASSAIPTSCWPTGRPSPTQPGLTYDAMHLTGDGIRLMIDTIRGAGNI